MKFLDRQSNYLFSGLKLCLQFPDGCLRTVLVVSQLLAALLKFMKVSFHSLHLKVSGCIQFRFSRISTSNTKGDKCTLQIITCTSVENQSDYSRIKMKWNVQCTHLSADLKSLSLYIHVPTTSQLYVLCIWRTLHDHNGHDNTPLNMDNSTLEGCALQ